MTKLIIIRSTLYMALVFTACTKSSQNCSCSDVLPQKIDTANIQSHMKGWELYSWPAEAGQSCKDWNFTILPGTNRLKSYNEVTNDTILLKVSGEKQLKLLLNKFPANEDIIWVGENWLYNIWGQSSINYGNLKLPSSSVINEIKQHCMQNGLRLTISQ